MLIEERSYDNMFTLVTVEDTDTVRDVLKRFAGNR